ncbi:PLP-dependent transferase [Nadsonia fulvescens var. elongata DSM 6958]|uniref:serine C-palmitoyltransferase n=1 Tax=Nadsonia fulvescens var. elongata DSM 6958 TaxID=857566 RepID=A0A1E3PKD2_9ASCO|nr:PLP-dependent transferase [Nadsonia fulvescens var. elongata DSM 6958]
MDQSVINDWVSYINDATVVTGDFFRSLPGSSIIIRYIKSSYQDDPIRSIWEALLFIFAVHYFLASKKSYLKKNYVPLSEREVDELVNEWEPEPLVQPLQKSEQWDLSSIPVIHGAAGVKVNAVLNTTGTTKPKQVLNCASNDFLSFANDESIKAKAVEVIRQYGVGSCGPPGFYGQQKAHISFESTISKFMGAQDAIVYAQAFNTGTSVIPSFLKRGDIVIADAGINLSVQKGIQMSRVTVRWYQHNDMKDLEKVLEQTNKEFRKRPLTRRFIITEALFENSGDSPDLQKIVELKYKYKYRLMLDETWSLGILGKTGRGLLEEYPLVSRDDIEITFGSMAHALGGGGGYCIGSRSVVKHQRIGSLAVVFSASMPAYLAVCAEAAIEELSDTSSGRMAKLHKNAVRLNEILATANLRSKNKLTIISRPDSPYILVKISEKYVDENYGAMEKKLQEITDECFKEGIMITRSKRLQQYEVIPIEHTLKICASIDHSENDLNFIGSILFKAVNKVLP